jgi:hypothetical protein
VEWFEDVEWSSAWGSAWGVIPLTSNILMMGRNRTKSRKRKLNSPIVPIKRVISTQVGEK